ncbi:MAG TPA: LPS assembly lipoprotein LptE [Acetobacteraceae bacterium]|nr:LPS assembly lipoprotein LptE [Acetobacteraceae bacterium]
MNRRSVLAMLSGTLLSGCGFHPVYAPRTAAGGASPVLADLARVSVGIIPDRQGQLLRQAIQDRLERGGIAADIGYDLSVNYGISNEGAGILGDNSTTYARIIGRANWVLRAASSPRAVITSGSARAVDGYDYLDQQYFATDLADEAVKRRLANAVADQIALQLAAFFAKRTAAPG